MIVKIIKTAQLVTSCAVELLATLDNQVKSSSLIINIFEFQCTDRFLKTGPILRTGRFSTVRTV